MFGELIFSLMRRTRVTGGSSRLVGLGASSLNFGPGLWMPKQTNKVGWHAIAASLALMAVFGPAAAQDAKAPKAAAGASSGGDSGLKSRVETLEEQLVDMQVVIGTLESMAKGGARPAPFPGAGAADPPGGGSPADAARIEALETQVRALTDQIQQLSDQVRGLGGTPRRSEAPALRDTDTAMDAGGDSGGFGSTTVSPGGQDAIGGLIDSGPSSAGSVASGANFGGQPPPVQTAALPPAGDGADPKQLYETAYGYLLQRDYGAAQAAFDDFLKRYPSDSLSGNAQYWLGESYFVRGQYKAAAGSFLKGYQSYAQSAKAPDSLLKLAMSLDRLGQKDAACSSYAELSTKFPSAPQSVKARAQSERQRVGC